MTKNRRIARVGLALTAVCFGLSGWAQSGDDATMALLTYKIKAGDTLRKIASNYLIEGADIDRVAQINHIKDIDLILAGNELSVPKAWVQNTPSTATVMSLSCAAPIALRNGTELKVGQKVSENAIIDVPAECHLGLVLEDGSTIRLPSSASIKITRLQKNKLQSTPEVRLELVKGRVELQVHKGRGKSTPFEVQTPISIMGVRGTEFRVGYSQADQTGQVEVLEGGVQTQGSQDVQSQLVEKGFGAPISREGKVLGIEKLLEAPQLVGVSLVEGSASTYLVRLQPQSNASYYLADSSPNANASGERNTQQLLAPEFLLGGLSQQAVFYQFKAVSALALIGKESNYAICAPEKANGRCSILFDTPLANNTPIKFVLQLQNQDQKQDLLNVNNLLAKKGRFSIQGLQAGKYHWSLSYKPQTGPSSDSEATRVTQSGEFELLSIQP